MRSVARSRPAVGTDCGDGRESAPAPRRDRDAASTGTPAPPVRALLADDRAGHEIARGQLARVLVARHEALAADVQQLRAFTAQRFREQESRRARRRRARWDGTGRTRDPRRARPQTTPASRRRRWRSADWWFRETPGPRRRWPATPRRHGPRAPTSLLTNRAPMQRPPLDDQLDRARVALDAHARLLRHALPQRAAELAAGGIGRMQHAPAAMRAFAAERQRARVVAIEPRAPLDQFVHVAHAVFDQHAHGGRRRTGRHRRRWCRPRVARAYRRGQPRRQCRPARSRCCSRWDWPSSGRARRRRGARSAAARRPAMPLPMIRKSVRRGTECYPSIRFDRPRRSAPVHCDHPWTASSSRPASGPYSGRHRQRRDRFARRREMNAREAGRAPPADLEPARLGFSRPTVPQGRRRSHADPDRRRRALQESQHRRARARCAGQGARRIARR